MPRGTRSRWAAVALDLVAVHVCEALTGSQGLFAILGALLPR
jgi:hypothetical protein